MNKMKLKSVTPECQRVCIQQGFTTDECERYCSSHQNVISHGKVRVAVHGPKYPQLYVNTYPCVGSSALQPLPLDGPLFLLLSPDVQYMNVSTSSSTKDLISVVSVQVDYDKDTSQYSLLLGKSNFISGNFSVVAKVLPPAEVSSSKMLECPLSLGLAATPTTHTTSSSLKSWVLLGTVTTVLLILIMVCVFGYLDNCKRQDTQHP